MPAKFKIGDMVYFKSGLGDCLTSARFGLMRLPAMFTITGVYTEECHDGTQYHYAIRTGPGYTKINETELIDPLDWNYSEWIDTWSAGRKAHPEVAKFAGQHEEEEKPD